MSDQDPLVPVPIPALVVLLTQLEARKGAPLSEDEVLAARDGAVCMMMRQSVAQLSARKRGYADLDPENVWEEWQAFCRERNAEG
jgi:hypothetical protein